MPSRDHPDVPAARCRRGSEMSWWWCRRALVRRSRCRHARPDPTPGGRVYDRLMPRRRWAVVLVAFLVGGLLALTVPHTGVGHADGCTGPAPLATQEAPPSSGFHAIVPERVMDTRTTAPVGAGCTAVLDLASTTAVPADAEAVALNVTAVDAPGRGLVTVYPCGSPRPSASNLNPRPFQPTANSAVVQVDATRRVCMYTYTSLDLVVDVTGWFGRFGDPFHQADGRRLLDTRTTDLRPDGGRGPLRARTELRVPIVGFAAPEGATAVSINVTTTDAVAPGFVTAYPCGGGRPDTSTVNYLAGRAARRPHDHRPRRGRDDLRVGVQHRRRRRRLRGLVRWRARLRHVDATDRRLAGPRHAHRARRRRRQARRRLHSPVRSRCRGSTADRIDGGARRGVDRGRRTRLPHALPVWAGPPDHLDRQRHPRQRGAPTSPSSGWTPPARSASSRTRRCTS